MITIEPGKIFYVPLTWFIKEKSIYIQKRDGNFHLLYPNIREYFAPSSLKTTNHNHIYPQNVEVYDNMAGDSRYVSVNIALFKNKPTTSNVPG